MLPWIQPLLNVNDVSLSSFIFIYKKKKNISLLTRRNLVAGREWTNLHTFKYPFDKRDQIDMPISSAILSLGDQQ